MDDNPKRWIVGKQGTDDAADPRALWPIVTADGLVCAGYAYMEHTAAAIANMLNRPIKPEIVCLCGSTRFMEAFHAAGWALTLQGKIVLTVGVCKHAEHHGGEALGQDVVAKLDELHFRKIDISDWVFILNVVGYIGDSTANEIEYAENAGKPVYYLETGHTPDNPEAKQLIETIRAAVYSDGPIYSGMDLGAGDSIGILTCPVCKTSVNMDSAEKDADGNPCCSKCFPPEGAK